MTFRDRFRFAWEITWPMALLDLAVVVTLHGILDVQGESAESIWALVAFFGVSPWIIRRALNLPYGKQRIIPKLTYQQSLKVMWLLAWRTLALSLAALVPISLILRAMHVNLSFNDQSPLVNNLGLSAFDALSSLAFTPLLVGGMLRKKYRGFRLELVEQAEPQPVSAAPKKRRK